MSAVAVLSLIALAAAIIAAAAVTAVAVRAYSVMRRLERLADQIGQTLEGEFTRALTELAEAARGLRRSAGNVDHALTPLTTLFHRLEGLAATLTLEALVAAVVPTVTKAGGWLTGARRVVEEFVRHGRGADGAKR